MREKLQWIENDVSYLDFRIFEKAVERERLETGNKLK